MPGHADTKRKPEKKFERRAEDRPGEILSAARTLFERKGFTATRADEIAAAAGISKGTLFRYFADKEAMLVAIVETVQIPAKDRMVRLVQSFEPPFAPKLGILAHTWYQMVQAEGIDGIPKMIMAEAGNFPDLTKLFKARLHDSIIGMLTTLVRRGVESGEFTCDDCDYSARYLLGSLMFLGLWNNSIGKYADDPMDAERYIGIWHKAACAHLGAPIPAAAEDDT